ncbi:MAG: universal stress protein [Dialister sp.]|nr:universal stress protein [Dialister sp.]
MLSFKKILVPYDGSEYSKRALAHAVMIANESNHPKLYVVSVEEDHSDISANNLEREFINERMRSINYSPAQDNLDKAKTQIPESLDADYIPRKGSPTEIIEKLADHIGPDLIIMGSRGHGALTGMLLGSVSNHMLAHAKCPVCIVK